MTACLGSSLPSTRRSPSSSARRKNLNLDYVTSFAEFGYVLLGRYQTDWKQVLHVHFPEPVDTEVVEPAQDRALAENFSRAIDLFLICTLNEKRTRDRQYNYLAPGGDHDIHKELLMSPLDLLGIVAGITKLGARVGERVTKNTKLK